MDSAFVAEERTMDMILQSEQDWLLDVQRKLYQWSRNKPRLRHHDWRAGCVTKGACPVLREDRRNLPPKAARRCGPTLPGKRCQLTLNG